MPNKLILAIPGWGRPFLTASPSKSELMKFFDLLMMVVP
jgi:hypothetical protein